MENNTLNTALLVMDMQQAVLHSLSDNLQIISNVAKSISAARSHNIPVIYITVGFRPGMPEISASNKMFAASKLRADQSLPGSMMMNIDERIAPADGDIMIVKRRVSAFTGSDLEVVLRSLEIKHLVLTGVATSGVVLSTLREAADKDYQITVLADCCTDRDANLHQVLVTKVFPMQANVIELVEWCLTTT